MITGQWNFVSQLLSPFIWDIGLLNITQVIHCLVPHLQLHCAIWWQQTSFSYELYCLREAMYRPLVKAWKHWLSNQLLYHSTYWINNKPGVEQTPNAFLNHKILYPFSKEENRENTMKVFVCLFLDCLTLFYTEVTWSRVMNEPIFVPFPDTSTSIFIINQME